MSRLEAYQEVVPQGTVDFLMLLAEKVQGKRVLEINSTRVGGGVAEILRSLVPLFREIGLECRWEVISGTEEFFNITKSFHNALQGQEQNISPRMLQAYLEVNRENAGRLSFDADYVIIHDPQPAALIDSRPSAGKWIWRCHIDVSRPQSKVWNFLRSICRQIRRGHFLFARLCPQTAHPPVSHLSFH